MLKKNDTPLDDKIHALDQLHKGVIDNAVEAIIIIDSKGIIQSVNTATKKIFGRSAKELQGKNIKVIMPDHDAAKHNKNLNKYLKTGKKNIIGIGRELEGIRKDGTIFPMHLSVSEFKIDGITYFSGMIRDLSGQKNVERALQKAASINALLHHTAEPANAATSVDDAISNCLTYL